MAASGLSEEEVADLKEVRKGSGMRPNNPQHHRASSQTATFFLFLFQTISLHHTGFFSCSIFFFFNDEIQGICNVRH